MPHHWSDEDRSTFKTAALAEVNSHILEAAQESSAASADWEFFCECGQPDCRELVTLSLPGYASLRERGEPVLAPNHLLPPATNLPTRIEARPRAPHPSEAPLPASTHRPDLASIAWKTGCVS